MTDFELGFRRGEQDAWGGRNEPLPEPQKPTGENSRGYWAARLPRSAAWARCHTLPQTWWDESLGQYVGPGLPALEVA